MQDTQYVQNDCMMTYTKNDTALTDTTKACKLFRS